MGGGEREKEREREGGWAGGRAGELGREGARLHTNTHMRIQSIYAEDGANSIVGPFSASCRICETSLQLRVQTQSALSVTPHAHASR